MSLITSIQDYANQCVKCGLCLPSCPTYQQTQNEGHSPRGRIHLMNMLDQNSIADDPGAQNYLNHCLTCRACEAVCPSEVSYGYLIDTSRAYLAEKRILNSLPWWTHFISKYRNAQRLSHFLLNILRYIKIRPFLNSFSIFNKFFNFLSTIIYFLERQHSYYYKKTTHLQVAYKDKVFKYHKKMHKSNLGQINLFQGCVENIIDHKLLVFSKKFLNLCGYAVMTSFNLSCCGALHLHQGDYKTTIKMAQKNLKAFKNAKKTLFLSSACGLTLKEYASHPLLKSHLSHFNENDFINILDFISDHVEKWGWPPSISFEKPEGKYAIHIPCTEKNGLKTQSAIRFLSLVPHMLNHIIDFDHKKSSCCGGAGIYFTKQETMSKNLAENCLQDLLTHSPIGIFTTNLGCKLQLQIQLNRLKLDIPIFHPLEFLMKIFEFS